MNDTWTILVSVQFISSKTFFKSHYTGLHKNRQRTFGNQRKIGSLKGRISELFGQFRLYMWKTVRYHLLLVNFRKRMALQSRIEHCLFGVYPSEILGSR